MTTQNGNRIPSDYLYLADYETTDNPLFVALGCLSCERLIHEANNRLGRCLSPGETLWHPETYHPVFSEIINNWTGHTVYCPLLNPWMTHPDLRKQLTPCQIKTKVTVDY